MKYICLICVITLASCFKRVSSSVGQKETLKVKSDVSKDNNGDEAELPDSTTTTSTTTSTTSTSTTTTTTTSTSSTTTTTLQKTVTFDQFKKVISDHCINCHQAGGQANTMDFDNIDGFIEAQFVIKGQWEMSPLLYRSKFYDDDPDSDPGKVDSARQDMPRNSASYDEDDYKLLKQFILEL